MPALCRLAFFRLYKDAYEMNNHNNNRVKTTHFLAISGNRLLRRGWWLAPNLLTTLASA